MFVRENYYLIWRNLGKQRLCTDTGTFEGRCPSCPGAASGARCGPWAAQGREDHRAQLPGVQGANIDARARQLRAGAWMPPEITDASCAAMGGPVPPWRSPGARCGP